MWGEGDEADLGNVGGQARRQGQPSQQDRDAACCWSPQPDQEEWLVLCLTLLSLYIIFNGYLMVVLCMPWVTAL